MSDLTPRQILDLAVRLGLGDGDVTAEGFRTAENGRHRGRLYTTAELQQLARTSSPMDRVEENVPEIRPRPEQPSRTPNAPGLTSDGRSRLVESLIGQFTTQEEPSVVEPVQEVPVSEPPVVEDDPHAFMRDSRVGSLMADGLDAVGNYFGNGNPAERINALIGEATVAPVLRFADMGAPSPEERAFPYFSTENDSNPFGREPNAIDAYTTLGGMALSAFGGPAAGAATRGTPAARATSRAPSVPGFGPIDDVLPQARAPSAPRESILGDRLDTDIMDTLNNFDNQLPGELGPRPSRLDAPPTPGRNAVEGRLNDMRLFEREIPIESLPDDVVARGYNQGNIDLAQREFIENMPASARGMDETVGDESLLRGWRPTSADGENPWQHYFSNPETPRDPFSQLGDAVRSEASAGARYTPDELFEISNSGYPPRAAAFDPETEMGMGFPQMPGNERGFGSFSPRPYSQPEWMGPLTSAERGAAEFLASNPGARAGSRFHVQAFDSLDPADPPMLDPMHRTRGREGFLDQSAQSEVDRAIELFEGRGGPGSGRRARGVTSERNLTENRQRGLGPGWGLPVDEPLTTPTGPPPILPEGGFRAPSRPGARAPRVPPPGIPETMPGNNMRHYNPLNDPGVAPMLDDVMIEPRANRGVPMRGDDNIVGFRSGRPTPVSQRDMPSLFRGVADEAFAGEGRPNLAPAMEAVNREVLLAREAQDLYNMELQGGVSAMRRGPDTPIGGETPRAANTGAPPTERELGEAVDGIAHYRAMRELQDELAGLGAFEVDVRSPEELAQFLETTYAEATREARRAIIMEIMEAGK